MPVKRVPDGGPEVRVPGEWEALLDAKLAPVLDALGQIRDENARQRRILSGLPAYLRDTGERAARRAREAQVKARERKFIDGE